jgi:hypothetical protein
MAAGEITLNGSPLGLGTAVTSRVTAGSSNTLEFAGFSNAEYAIGGSVLIRGALIRGEVFNFAHWFSYEDADKVQAMEFVASRRENNRAAPYHVLLIDERCKVPDTDPPTYAYVTGSLEVIQAGIATKTHRVYKAIFRNGPPVIKSHSTFGKELVFEMQVGDPFFAAEQLPPPPLTLISVGSVPENADTSSNTYLLAEFS